jgi:hypothetical protein
MYYSPTQHYFSYLFTDRLSDMEVAPGYYLTKKLITNHLPVFKSFLKSSNENEVLLGAFESLIESLIEDEHKYFNNLISENTDFIISNQSCDDYSEGYICIYRKGQFDAPYLIKINSEYVKEYSESNGIIFKDDLSQIIPNDFSGGMIPDYMYKTIASYYAKINSGILFSDDILYCADP